jgi:tripartite-type tricarboxylate transporter receptor subunit TctC
MKIPRRKILHPAAGAVALTSVPRFAFAQAYPTRPVRWIVAVAPGGGNDVFARLMGQWLSVRLGRRSLSRTGPVRATISVRRPS